MNRIFKFVVIAVFFIAAGRVAGASPKGIAVGVHGIGNEWSDGAPLIRWQKSETLGFEFTPTFTQSNSDQVDRAEYGLNIGIIKKLSKQNGFETGLKVGLGYDYSRQKQERVVGESLKEISKTATLSLGLDFEYFLPLVPNLSIGANLSVYVSYSREEPYLFNPEVNNTWSAGLQGEVLTVRYYF